MSEAEKNKASDGPTAGVGSTDQISHDADALAAPEAATTGKHEDASTRTGAAPASRGEEVKISVSRGFADWLATNSVSIAVTSYQTGQLMLIGTLPQGRVSVFQRNFVRAMGLCATPQRIYLAAIAQIWRLENVLGAEERANQFFDRLYLPRAAHTTGDVDAHEIAVDKDGGVIFVNTKYSCLATFSDTHSFRPIWKPPFITKLAPEDRCHLNGLAMEDGRPKYVTAISRGDVVDSWRERRGDGGLLLDVDTGKAVVENLSMPHSPRLANGALWLLDSGRGHLCRVDQQTNRAEAVAFCPGFLRGLSFWRSYAAVGLSLPRDGAFKGLALDEAIKSRDGAARCGVFIIDTRTGDILHWLQFESGIKELFDVAFIPGVKAPMCVGLASPEMRTFITCEDEGSSQVSSQEFVAHAATAS